MSHRSRFSFAARHLVRTAKAPAASCPRRQAAQGRGRSPSWRGNSPPLEPACHLLFDGVEDEVAYGMRAPSFPRGELGGTCRPGIFAPTFSSIAVFLSPDTTRRRSVVVKIIEVPNLASLGGRGASDGVSLLATASC